MISVISQASNSQFPLRAQPIHPRTDSMNGLQVFVDGSVDNQSRIGIGAYLVIPEDARSVEFDSSEIKIQRFENTSSSQLEIQATLYALKQIKDSNRPIVIYTDSQNIVRLPGRRKKLEEQKFLNRNGKLISNSKLYQNFYDCIDRFDCNFVKVDGHKPSSEKDPIDRIFAQVDKAARKALGGYLASKP